MWKMLVGFVAFAALVLFVLTRSGAQIDMGGEKHGIDVPQAPANGPAASAAK